MNTEEESGDQCSKVEDKIDHETKEESLEPHVNLPAKSLEDGSGDHFSPSKVQPTLAADIPDDVTKNLTEGISETKKDIEIGDGDHKKDITDTDVPQESPNVKISDTLKICDKPVQSEADDNDSCNFEEDFIALIKPTEGSVSEDVDSENQDEELVLKWDDDDEDGSITSLKDDEIVKNLDTESTDVTKAECVENADIDNSETAIAKDIDLIESVELQSSKDDELIVVTNAKASENVDMMLSTKTSEDDLIESSEPKTSEDDVLIESGTSEDDDFIESGDPKISKGDDLIESIEPKSSEGDDFIESIEPKASEDDDLIESSETKTSEDDDDLLSEIDAQIAELGASISKAENEKLMNIEKSKESTLPGNNEDNTETTVSALQEAISHESNVRTAEVDLTNEKQDHLSTYDTVTSVIKIDEIEDKPDDLKMEVEEALLKNDNDDIQTEIYKTKLQSPKADSSINQMEVDSSNKTEDVAENTEKDSDIEMEIDNSANLEDPNLTLDLNQEENLTKNVDILANSTKLDNSSVNELETSGNDTFVHDSSSSIEDITHGVNKPNIMLEIPTQELIDFDETVLSQDKETATDEHRNENISVDLADDKNFANETDEARDIDSIEKSKNSVLEKQSDDKGIEEKLILKVTEQNALKTTSDRKEISPEGLPKTDDTSADDSKTKSDVIPSQDIEKSDRPLPTEDCINEEIETKKSDNKSPSSTKSDDAKDENVIQDGSSLPKDDTTVRDEDTAKDTLIHLPVDKVKSTNAIDQKYGDSLLVNIYASKKDDINKDLVDVQPSTSQMALQPTPEPSDDAAEVTEATDSLGLLAESSRVRDEQDEEDVDPDADDQESSEHDDNDDDFDPDDESSNQQTAEHSEDSAQHSESETPKPQDIEKDTETNKPFCLLDSINEETGETGAGEIDKEDVNKDKEFGIEISNVVTEDDKESDGDMDIDDEIVLEEVEVSSVVVGDTETATEEVDMTALQDKVDESTKEQVPAPAEIPFKVHTESKLRQLLRQGAPDDITVSPAKKKLEISQPKHVVSIVDLESSSEDEGVAKPLSELKEQTSINISKEIDVMSSGDTISDIVSKEDETVITVPRSPALKKLASRLNTSELTIKTKPSTTESTLVIPETKMGAPTASKFGGLEVFNLDSDEEDYPAPPPREPTPEPEPEKPRSKCINSLCISDSSVPFYPANPSTAAYYESRKKKRPMVCEICLYSQVQRSQKLVEGIKNYTPLLQLEEVRCSQELVEISDSDSDEEAAHDPHAADKIGDQAGVLERQLADMINATWERFQMDARLKDAEDELALDLERLEKESVEVNQMLDECQVATDKLRIELYATFEVQRHQLPGLIVYDTPDRTYICPEAQVQNEVQNKRRLSSASESQAKKPAIPLGPATDKPDTPTVKTEEPKAEPVPSADSKIDDDKDISVVTLSAEVAPADLPPPGDIVRDPLQVGQVIYAMRHAFGSWFKASVLEVTPKGTSPTAQNFTMCRVKFENKSSRIAYKLLPARCLAYYEPANVRMTIGTRVIALFKDTSADKSGKRESYYSGVVAEVPNPVNKYRYLVFFDDGYAQYVAHADTRLVCEFAALVWEEVHPFSREFVREYLLAYPERPMVRLHTGQSLKTEWNGKWWLSRVVQVDASLAQVYFEQDKRTEWIYRGSTRLAPLYLELQAAEKHRARPLPRNRAQTKLNMPYVEYTRLDEQAPEPTKADAINKAQQEEIRRQRSVAKKSTMPQNLPPQQPTAGNLDAVTSRVVYYTPKNAVKPYKMTSHTCGPKCRRTDVLALKDLRTYNPLAKPLLSGWERQIVRYKGHKEVMYRAPCGRRLRTMAELHRYLRTVNSDMGVDLFDFGPNTHCLAEFVLNKCIVGKKDLSHGKENVPVPCVNYYDESLPEFCSYNTERTPTAGVPLNLDPEFLCGCDCTDDCQDKSKCACWKMTQEGARTIGLDPRRVGYVYKRLPEPLPSGIYECNVRCKCRSTCLNRVAQHPLQLKLQVFKTLNRGWGIRSLNDVPKGSFLCIYAGNLLTDATANLDGLNEGDEYLAELDFIEVVEQMKEGYEDDIPDRDKKLDRENQESDSEETESEEEAANSKSDAEDGDFEPGYIPGVISGFNKRLRKRDKKKKDKELREKEAKKEMGEDDCITISDDEELREPSSFAAQAGMGGQFISKYRSVRTLFGKDEACYIMDAKVQGNIGRYLNHSCSPNVFVQNVFVDTHDPRFPWVAFFALAHIRAGTELTWNYNYDVGSVPGKALYCYCGAPNCRGRLL